MSNHLSYVDSWVVASKLLPRSLTFVAMGKIFKIPILGQVLRLSRHIPVEFYRDKEDGNKFKVKRKELLMKRAKYAIEKGRRLVVFPEGKLSKDGYLNPFKIGFFRTSIETGAPILPAAMWGNHTIFPPGNQYAAAHPGVVEITFGELISPEENETAEELRDRVRVAIEGLQLELPSYKKWLVKQEQENKHSELKDVA